MTDQADSTPVPTPAPSTADHSTVEDVHFHAGALHNAILHAHATHAEIAAHQADMARRLRMSDETEERIQARIRALRHTAAAHDANIAYHRIMAQAHVAAMHARAGRP